MCGEHPAEWISMVINDAQGEHLAKESRAGDINLLRTLVALIEEKSTVHAARRLRLSQPSVSQALSRLRLMFSDELLVRTGRNLEPTSRAQELLQSIRPHLEGLDSAMRAAATFDPALDRHVFRFGCTDAVALSVLPRLTRALRQDAPGCSLVVRVGDYRVLPEMLASAEISTALAYLRVDPAASTKVKVLRHSPWVVVRDGATAPLSGLDDFCSRSHALVTPSGDMAGFVDDGLKLQGRERRVAIGVTSFALLLGVLPGSDLIATVPDFVAERLAAFGGLAIDPCPVAVPLVTNTLAWRAAADKDPAERWFRQQVVLAFGAAEEQPT
jgi:LysR family transcriptional regulator, mexEF-oprN operon transcriptional activator